ncbi:MAG: hypothetical protein LBH59_02015 [Planctomycetaceae bacterium]|nr:hypothetical protein [Planctomycetaceae bacterium]
MLQKYGFSSGDLEITSEEERLSGALPLKFKDGTNNDELLLEMFIDDPGAFDGIVQHLSGTFSNMPSEFTYNFSYKNGITIENGYGNQSALNKRYENLIGDPKLPTEGNKISVSYTINPSGEIINSEINDQYFKNVDRVNTAFNSNVEILKGELAKLTDNDSSIFPSLNSKSRFQQYVFESQRLFIFNTGVNKEDAEQLNITLDRSYYVKRKRPFSN